MLSVTRKSTAQTWENSLKVLTNNVWPPYKTWCYTTQVINSVEWKQLSFYAMPLTYTMQNKALKPHKSSTVLIGNNSASMQCLSHTGPTLYWTAHTYEKPIKSLSSQKTFLTTRKYTKTYNIIPETIRGKRENS